MRDSEFMGKTGELKILTMGLKDSWPWAHVGPKYIKSHLVRKAIIFLKLI